MTSEQHDAQAAVFISYHERRGGDWEENFEVWAFSKDFLPLDQLRIRRASYELLLADSVCVDPFEYLNLTG